MPEQQHNVATILCRRPHFGGKIAVVIESPGLGAATNEIIERLCRAVHVVVVRCVRESGHVVEIIGKPRSGLREKNAPGLNRRCHCVGAAQECRAGFAGAHPKYADHLPLYRQSQIYARQGVELERSTLADWVGDCSRLLAPLVEALGGYVLGAQKLHADDTPVPVLERKRQPKAALTVRV